MEIRGQGALVTGGGSGLGAATARRLAADGARVTVLDIDEGAARGVAAEIGGTAIGCDVADAADAEAALAAARYAHGRPAVLVNCAGIAAARRIVGREGPMPLDEFRRVIDVNLVGTFNLTRLAAAEMFGRTPDPGGERGVIVCTASVAAFEGQIGQAAYAASKGGVAALTIQMAREFAAAGVRVLSIAPGLFDTPMVRNLPDGARAGLEAAVPFPGRMGRPEEYAGLVAHIVANAMLNGETIRLDGALRMPPR